VVRPPVLNELGPEYSIDHLVDASLLSFGFDAQQQQQATSSSSGGNSLTNVTVATGNGTSSTTTTSSSSSGSSNTTTTTTLSPWSILTFASLEEAIAHDTAVLGGSGGDGDGLQVSNVLFIFGLNSTDSTRLLTEWMTHRTELQTFLPYTELVLQWRSLNATLKDDTSPATAAAATTAVAKAPPSVTSRMHWASSLPNWMVVAKRNPSTESTSSGGVGLTQRGFLSTYAKDTFAFFYESRVGQAATRSLGVAEKSAFVNRALEDPFTFYSYATTDALHAIASSFESTRPYLIEAGVTHDLLYRSKILHLQGGLVFGNFLNLNSVACGSEALAECQCSNGGRELYLYRGDSAVARGEADPELTYTFTDCQISYAERVGEELVEQLTRLSKVEVALAASLSAAGILLIVLGILVGTTKGRNQKGAVKDSSKPFAVMFTDIENSSALWAAVPEAMLIALDQHHTILRKVIAKYQGFEVKTIGDAFMIVHSDPEQAFDMCVAIQKALNDFQEWPEGIAEGYRRISAKQWLQDDQGKLEEVLLATVKQRSRKPGRQD
jgi:hypothetical protein